MRMGRAGTQGVTLIEVVVATAIMGLVVTVVYAVLQSGILGWRTGELRYEVQQNLRVALDRLSRELRETNVAEVELNDTTTPSLPGDVILAFKSARMVDGTKFVERKEPECTPSIPSDYSGDYSPCWQAYIVYYLTEEGGSAGPYILRRQVIPLSSPDETLSSLSGYLNPATARPVARRISNFLAVKNMDGTIDVTLEGEGEVPNLPLQTLELKVQISPRN